MMVWWICFTLKVIISPSPLRLSEQPFPWFQGIRRHPRYSEHAAKPQTKTTQLLLRSHSLLVPRELYMTLCVALCSLQTYLCSFGTEERPRESQLRFLCLEWKPTRQPLQLLSAWRLMCVIHQEASHCNTIWCCRTDKGDVSVETCRHFQTPHLLYRLHADKEFWNFLAAMRVCWDWSFSVLFIFYSCSSDHVWHCRSSQWQLKTWGEYQINLWETTQRICCNEIKCFTSFLNKEENMSLSSTELAEPPS